MSGSASAPQPDGDRPTFGLIGDPVAHSLSPAMHRAAFRELTFEAEYLPVRVSAEAPMLVAGEMRRLAASGRDAGRINIHSFPARRDAKRSELLAEVRGLLVADEDESWISSDLSAIEPRVLALLAGEDRLVELFASGVDVYRLRRDGVPWCDDREDRRERSPA